MSCCVLLFRGIARSGARTLALSLSSRNRAAHLHIGRDVLEEEVVRTEEADVGNVRDVCGDGVERLDRAHVPDADSVVACAGGDLVTV